jgi:hypothetical protein
VVDGAKDFIALQLFDDIVCLARESRDAATLLSDSQQRSRGRPRAERLPRRV